MASLLNCMGGGGQGLKGKPYFCFLFSKKYRTNEKNIKFLGKNAFSIAEAMIVLLLVSVALAMSAPLISRQMKDSSASAVQLTQLIRRMDELGDGVPVGAVMFFDLGKCPENWEPLINKYPSANGAFLRNISGMTRDLGSFEQSAAPNITGSLRVDRSPLMSGEGSITVGYSDLVQGVWTGSVVTTFFDVMQFDASRSSSVYGRDNATEVRPDNIALLACRKKQ